MENQRSTIKKRSEERKGIRDMSSTLVLELMTKRQKVKNEHTHL